jgi:glycolate oxidase FAD binding subunit
MQHATPDIYTPASEEELASLVTRAAETRTPLEVVGNATKRAVGRPMQTAATLSTSALTGISLYEPTELVMSAGAGTPIATVEQELARNGQMLAFEPVDLGPLNGSAADTGTIGSVFLTNLAGSRRISAGAPRDHLLGLRAVNGRGEVFKSGGRVMKNVTGYDICRLLTGSWGTLAVASEVTFKVQPMPEETRTLVFLGLHDDIAVEVLCEALGTPYEVSGTLHLHTSLARRLRSPQLRGHGAAITALRLESFSSFMGYRTQRMIEQFKPYGDVLQLDDGAARTFWAECRQLSFFQGTGLPVWRISTKPTLAPTVVKALKANLECSVAYDWSGGLIWAELSGTGDAGATDVRRVIAKYGGHATLMRADVGVRAAIDVFQPLDPPVQALTRGIKATFDPAGILNPGRMYATD